ncbi:replication protein [Salmonella enterica subsp. enterica serovar Sendai]|uniref:Replication protein n=1 Tax=Salmonella typhi TaxID=90370 RepID=A0A748F158_SALTI|nr:replication protein [Salmonella enterica subsp. enterica serovar Sendai]ECE7322552.1 replication protein [Salmonella enterica subsp. enterica serovar Paratyphi A]HAC6687592.1 replication protein [Salmonella enterica subsp. enterica serovar Sendai]HAE8725593.1 replication protein [Salmonella enterica subsp. enterica serovar Sendai]HAF5023721.1 replication protein [Salmonella enterica subsp. enterica serovar Typhi]
MFVLVLFRFLVNSLTTFGHRLAASGISSRISLMIPI